MKTTLFIVFIMVVIAYPPVIIVLGMLFWPILFWIPVWAEEDTEEYAEEYFEEVPKPSEPPKLRIVK